MVQKRFDDLADDGAALLRQLQDDFEIASGPSYSRRQLQLSQFPPVWDREWQWDSEYDIFGRRLDRDASIRTLVAELAEAARQLRRIVT